MKLNLTIAIPTFNEERHLESCLKAIGRNFAQEIFIIDSDSSDQTINIAKDYGVKLINFNWNGKFPKKRNWFLQNQILKTEWILFIDADEKLTNNFKKEISEVLKETRHSGFYINYSNYFLNKKLKGGIKMKKLALFKVNLGRYEKIDEQKWSNLDMEVHEHPIINGSIGSIKSEIDHIDFNGMSRYIKKHNEYSTWEAYRYLNLKNKKNFQRDFTLRQKLKYKLIKTPFLGIAYFILQYFIKGGWIDGGIGLSYAILKASYYVQISCKIYEDNYK